MKSFFDVCFPYLMDQNKVSPTHITCQNVATKMSSKKIQVTANTVEVEVLNNKYINIRKSVP